MQKALGICLLNDSFPPTVDGVATCVYNYASIIERTYGRAIVCTPSYPNVRDDYPFSVVRYPSIAVGGTLEGYRAGIPFNAKLLDHLRAQDIDLLHAHCPIMSALLARTLREQIHKPIVMSYHTKFDVEIEKALPLKSMQKAAARLLIGNVAACDEVWVVSRGAGENLRALGYEGEYQVMENGVDFAKGRAPEEQVRLINEQNHLTPDGAALLFVGRLMWYKGIRTILDGLKIARAQGAKFTMLFVGDGVEKNEIVAYAEELGLSDVCRFVPAVHDREVLRAYYTRANMFLFPSDFDTNGIVVREAAACGTPSLLLRGSCAAEGIIDGRNGLLIHKDASELSDAVRRVCADLSYAQEIGEHAMNEIYLSWEEAVARAYARYQIVCDNYARRARSAGEERPIHKGDDFFRVMAYVCKNKEHQKPLKRKLYKPKKHKVFKFKEGKQESRWL